ncbi:glycosyltransferase family 1 protein [Corticimicrobacter populi]|uniref:Glycosyltransferase family 1 protein n=2 Tax=Corticimicrobacter populi TaxID=2175229 RepID=A0A2V1K2G1_9BURK|nr:glycosyltransferase family 1 protein [Corticimicrobacter populi]
MMRKLKILHTEAATHMGGQEIYIYRHMLAMRERGHDMSLLCQPHAQLGQRARDAGFPVFTMKMGGFRRLLAGAVAARTLMREQRFDVVNTTSRRDTLIAAAGARLAGVPLIVRSRHLMSPINSLLSYTWLPHRILTVSEYVRNYMATRGIAPERVGIAPPTVSLPEERWGYPTDMEARCLAQRQRVRQEWGVADGDVVVGCVAILRPAKGHADLLAAMTPLFVRYPNLHLVLAGDGDVVMQELKAQAQASGVAGRVHFLGYRKDVADLLFGFDIFALATHKEASGTAFLEAAASGLPIVATDVGGVPEMVLPGRNALLFPLGNLPELTSALDTLAADSQRRKAMGYEGWKWIRSESRFSPDGQAALIENYYAQWLRELGHEVG